VVNGNLQMVNEINIQSTFPQKVKSQGRIVIPKIVREGLGIIEGDQVTVTVRKTKEAKA
jgi:AbrB family looped-hinge helix DNA binding protein